MRKDEIVERIIRFLSDHNITNYRFERRTRHYALVVEHAGKVATFSVPTSPSDSVHAPLNKVAEIRRTLGLQAKKTQPRPTRPKRPHRAKPTEVVRYPRFKGAIEATVQEDRFLGPLAELKARMVQP